MPVSWIVLQLFYRCKIKQSWKKALSLATQTQLHKVWEIVMIFDHTDKPNIAYFLVATDITETDRACAKNIGFYGQLIVFYSTHFLLMLIK